MLYEVITILIQVYFNSGLAYLLNRTFGVAHCVAAPSALIGGELLAAQQLAPQRVATLIADVADAVHHAHKQGLVHRDLKPDNILIDVHRNNFV